MTRPTKKHGPRTCITFCLTKADVGLHGRVLQEIEQVFGPARLLILSRQTVLRQADGKERASSRDDDAHTPTPADTIRDDRGGKSDTSPQPTHQPRRRFSAAGRCRGSDVVTHSDRGISPLPGPISLPPPPAAAEARTVEQLPPPPPSLISSSTSHRTRPGIPALLASATTRAPSARVCTTTVSRRADSRTAITAASSRCRRRRARSASSPWAPATAPPSRSLSVSDRNAPTRPPCC